MEIKKEQIFELFDIPKWLPIEVFFVFSRKIMNLDCFVPRNDKKRQQENLKSLNLKSLNLRI